MADPGILDQVTLQFLAALKQDGAVIERAARHLFYDLVVIQLTASALWMVLTGETLERLLIKCVQMGATLGFFYSLLSLGGQWVPAILNGFIELGQKGGVSSLDPSSIIDQGLSIAGAILKGFLNWGLLGHPFVSIIGAIVCLAIVVMYGFIAAELVIILVKSYVMVALSGLFFAFGGTRYTQVMAMNYVGALLGLGLNLMTLYLLLGVGQNLGSGWAQMSLAAAQKHELMPMLVVLAAVIVYHRVIKTVPSFVASLAGVGSLQHVGQETVQGAVRSTRTAVGVLALSGRRVQDVAKAGMAAAHLSKSAKTYPGGFQRSELASGNSFQGSAARKSNPGSHHLSGTKRGSSDKNSHSISPTNSNEKTPKP